jgi:pimeloyl-ACP methyl ester carboxylesterase
MRPIVLVHGLFGSLNDDRIVSAFDDAVVHAPDLIGYGIHEFEGTSKLSLLDQANHLALFIENKRLESVHLVGHSVGGAVAMLTASLYPNLVSSLTSIEGNFTIKDAFWSEQIAMKTDDEVAEIVSEYSDDPVAWIANAGVSINSWNTSVARNWLDNQPPSTIKAQANAVVSATKQADYLRLVRDLMSSSMPVNLIAGAKSAATWDVPDWANQMCSTRINIANVGHLMMLEDPGLFAQSIMSCIMNSK